MEFLFGVYAGTREEELAVLDWDDQRKEDFLRFQFNAQHKYYQENYPGALFQVILKDGAPVGRLYLHRRADEIRIMDIAVLREHRRLGIGTHLLGEVLAEGRQTGKRVSIHVERNNPALELYNRLGFKMSADRGVYWFLEWKPDGEGS
jgi:ribosomal protein S18 acetylase RimI-like enzyme